MNVKEFTRVGLSFSLAIAVAACSSQEKKEGEAAAEAPHSRSVKSEKVESEDVNAAAAAPAGNKQTKNIAKEEGAGATAELQFSRGSARLPGNAGSRVRKAVREARRGGTVSTVKVIAWADEEYPAGYKDALPETDQKLANDRARAVQRIVERSLPNATVEVISMAERPGAFAELFRTSDFRTKRSLERAGIPTDATAVKKPAMEGKTLVLFLTEEASRRN